MIKNYVCLQNFMENNVTLEEKKKFMLKNMGDRHTLENNDPIYFSIFVFMSINTRFKLYLFAFFFYNIVNIF